MDLRTLFTIKKFHCDYKVVKNCKVKIKKKLKYFIIKVINF